ncbi:MAG: SDR family oxidoreductase [Atribacterota bacterium]|nr:SDR family oxidoreductase [Atribacterota bacterium]MDD4896829.1 SDR family oxidoreductase [Atribacterota bacterium]MDD5637211.1 SDR family oxidoreductase [Atribacterota bacterium]
MKFNNKKVVITGGSRGIGEAIGREFKKEGARVAVIDKEDTQTDWEIFYQGDIADEKDLIKFTRVVREQFKKIDYLINNACLSKNGLLSNCSFTDFNYVLKVDVAAPYILTKLFLPFFNRGAAIINISSTRAFMSQPDTESYSTAKGGIVALTHAMAVSLAGKVRVNSVYPGWIDTSKDNNNWTDADRKQHPVKRIGKVEDIAHAVPFLCNEKSGFITGENLVVDGGMSRLMVYHNDYNWIYKGD